MKRKQWFIDRIGKRVFNTKFCDCLICQSYYESGMIIQNEFDAICTFGFEQDLQAEGNKLKYFDTKEERTIYETENNINYEQKE